MTIKISLEEEQVSANTPIVLTFALGCDTPEQVTDFIAATTFDITLDVDYKSVWSYPLGVLSAGTHDVDSDISLQWTVTDGFDFNGDGLPDEYSGTLNEFSLQIVVEE